MTIDIGVCSATSESFNRVKLSRLKYLYLQANKYLSKFLKWLASMFTVMESLIFEYSDSMNILCKYRVNMVLIWCEYCVSLCCLFRQSLGEVGRSNEHAGSVAELVSS